MKLQHLLFAPLAATLSFGAPALASAKLNVVTTTQDPGALTRAIGGDRVKVTALCKGFQDPHFLDAKPSYMVKLNKADLLVVIGLDLEIGYVPPLIQGARNKKIAPGAAGYLDLSRSVEVHEVIPVADRSQGDVHPRGNPHFWLDPENGRKIARAIAAKLTELDPKGAETYKANLASFEKDLDARLPGWAQRMEPFRGSKIVTYHKSWSYFAERYGLQIIDQVEPKPGIPPTPSHTLDLISEVKAQNARVIMMESYYDRRAPERIAKETGAKLVVVPLSVGGEKHVETYFDLIDTIISEFEEQAKS